jgi:hypothetical protein
MMRQLKEERNLEFDLPLALASFRKMNYEPVVVKLKSVSS